MKIKSDEDIQSIVKAACEEAIDFIESDIAPVRNKCQKYYDGETDLGYEEGTSKVVATKVRDTVRVIMPSLMRVFLASDKPVEFIPKGQEHVEIAKQATDYLWTEFRRMGGYQVLYEAMHDTVVKKNGFIKAYWDESDRIETEKHDNVTDEELVLIQREEGVEVVEITSEPIPMDYELPEGVPAPQIHSVEIERTITTGKLCMDVLPPEDFFIDEGATSLDDSLVYGQQTTMRVADLVAMGYKYDDVATLGLISEDETTEKFERSDYSGTEQMTKDPSMKEVTVTECFMRIDIEGDGKGCRYRFLCGGSEYKILEKEKWTSDCIADFVADPIPHLFFGRAPAELILNDQDSATSMIRGALNNIALVNMPRSVVNPEFVNLDDYLNNEIGAVVRASQMGHIEQLVTPPIANAVLPLMQYYDGVVEGKTGVNNLSAGLNPEILQNQTATAVNAVTQAGANQIEAITRHIAEGGMSKLFRIMLELIIDNAPEEVFMRQQDGQMVPVYPKSWDIDMDIHVNVGLGTSGDAEKSAALQGLIPLQREALMAPPGSTGVTPENLRNAIGDALRLSGVYDIDRYWPQAQPLPPQPPQPQVNPLAEVEQIKGQNRKQEKMMDLQVKMAELMAKDDLERDQMAQDLLVEYGKLLAQYGAKVDVAQIQRMQNTPRAPIFQNGITGVS